MISSENRTPREHQSAIRELLEAEGWFAEHRVRFFLQDDAEIKTLVAKKTGTLEGVTFVIAIDELEMNQPAVMPHFQFIITEQVLTNRSRADFASAMDVAWKAALLIDGEDYHVDNITQTMDEERGIFQTVVNLRY